MKRQVGHAMVFIVADRLFMSSELDQDTEEFWRTALAEQYTQGEGAG